MNDKRLKNEYSIDDFNNSKNDFLKAKELIDNGLYLDAEKILKKLHQQSPNSSAIKLELAHLWIISGIDVERGKRYLQKLLNYNDNRTLAFANMELGKYELNERKAEKAKEYFEKVLSNTRIKDKYFACLELIFLEIREENYEKAYELYEKLKTMEYYELFKGTLFQLEKYLEYKTNRMENPNSISSLYFFSQMMDYNEDKAIEHIKLHLDENDKKDKHTTYYNDVDVEELYHEARIRIKYINPISMEILDKYILEFNAPIGKINNLETRTARVLTFPNSDEIVTMYPVIHSNKKRI